MTVMKRAKPVRKQSANGGGSATRRAKSRAPRLMLRANFSDGASFRAGVSLPRLPRWEVRPLPEALAPLMALPNWVLWRWEMNSKTGKWTKVPYRPSGAKARNNDSKTWTNYETALKAVAKFDGIGFCLMNTEYAAFDLDDCVDPDTGAVAPWAQELVARVNSYTEVTISGTGLRIIGNATGKKVHRKQSIDARGSLETYRGAERYIVMTGNVLPETEEVLADIDMHVDKIVAELDAKKKDKGKEKKTTAQKEETYDDDIEDLIRNGCGDHYGGDRSMAVWYVVNELLRRGYRPASVEATLLDERNRISEHIYDQKYPEAYATKQVAKATKEIKFQTTDKGAIIPNQANIRVALLKLRVEVRYDEFSDQILIEGLRDFGPVLQDAAMDRLWLLIDQRFHFYVRKDLFYTIVIDAARLNKFHPVRDYLDGLKWDGVSRIDKWFSTYGGAVSSPYVDAVGALMLIAAVRRIRQPGIKFDEMAVLEGLQGVNKSSALRVLAVREDWFSDDLPLNLDGREVIERLRGRWIVECGELAGLKRGTIEHLKSFLSRQVDRSRMVWGRITANAPRQCVFFGSTNDKEYLRDHTGNRRIWPVAIKQFDLETLAHDRDQLWAEAAAREAAGASIRLDRELWAEAGEEQAARKTEDPFFEALHDALEGQQGKISSEQVWSILNMPVERRGQEQAKRVTEAMARLGWKRPKSRVVKIGGRNVTGFTKGAQPWREVDVPI